MSKPQSISLIVTTYNRPDALALVLDSALKQSRLPNEIIVADDGSGEGTRSVVRHYQMQGTVPVFHAWQEDTGFRLARSRNNAIRQSSGDYLIFVDGDTVLHHDFISDHVALSEKKVFTVGSRILLSESETREALRTQDFRFSFKRTDAPDKIKAWHCPSLSALLYRKKNTPIEKLIFRIRGCNMGFWREDCIAVNGFNQKIEGWGREDSEFAARLLKKGLFLKNLKFAAIQYHLYHPENMRTALPENDRILRAAMESEDYRCADGLDNP